MIKSDWVLRQFCQMPTKNRFSGRRFYCDFLHSAGGSSLSRESVPWMEACSPSRYTGSNITVVWCPAATRNIALKQHTTDLWYCAQRCSFFQSIQSRRIFDFIFNDAHTKIQALRIVRRMFRPSAAVFQVLRRRPMVDWWTASDKCVRYGHCIVTCTVTWKKSGFDFGESV